MAKTAKAAGQNGGKDDDAKAGGQGNGGNPDAIMSTSEMKPILAKARRGTPVNCAVCLTSDKDGVILLDRRRAPKKLFAELKKQAKEIGLAIDLPSLRFGRAMVDSDEDAALVTFAVNKEPPGAMRAKLLARVKRAGFTKVEITVEGDV